MRNIILYIIILTAGILCSCEKEIDVKLQGAAKKYVIEAVVTDKAGGCRVLISQTKDFNEDNTPITVSGARVQISTGDSSVVLTENAPGVYASSSLKGVPGTTYNLQVNIESETFTARSTMPSLVKMDSLYITEEMFFGDKYKLPTISYMDPAGVLNFYRFMVYVNGTKKKQIFALNDELTDGNRNATRLFVDVDQDDVEDEEKIKTGDLVKVEMLTIDAPIYKYFFSLENSATGDSNSATPANPVSNIQGGALGYFSVHTMQSMEVRVP